MTTKKSKKKWQEKKSIFWKKKSIRKILLAIYTKTHKKSTFIATFLHAF